MEAKASRETIIELASETNRKRKKLPPTLKRKVAEPGTVCGACVSICDQVYEAETEIRCG